MKNIITNTGASSASITSQSSSSENGIQDEVIFYTLFSIETLVAFGLLGLWFIKRKRQPLLSRGVAPPLILIFFFLLNTSDFLRGTYLAISNYFGVQILKGDASCYYYNCLCLCSLLSTFFSKVWMHIRVQGKLKLLNIKIQIANESEGKTPSSSVRRKVKYLTRFTSNTAFVVSTLTFWLFASITLTVSTVADDVTDRDPCGGGSISQSTGVAFLCLLGMMVLGMFIHTFIQRYQRLWKPTFLNYLKNRKERRKRRQRNYHNNRKDVSSNNNNNNNEDNNNNSVENEITLDENNEDISSNNNNNNNNENENENNNNSNVISNSVTSNQNDESKTSTSTGFSSQFYQFFYHWQREDPFLLDIENILFFTSIILEIFEYYVFNSITSVHYGWIQLFIRSFTMFALAGYPILMTFLWDSRKFRAWNQLAQERQIAFDDAPQKASHEELIKTTLSDDDFRHAFMNKCKQEQCFENLLCWEQIQKIKELPPASAQQQKEAQQLYETFFSPDAIFAVNTTQENCRRIRRLVYPDSFDEAQNNLKANESTNSLPSSTESYEDLSPAFEKVEREMVRLLVDPYLRFMNTKEFRKLEQSKKELFREIV